MVVGSDVIVELIQVKERTTTTAGGPCATEVGIVDEPIEYRQIAIDGRIADMVQAGIFTGPFVLSASITPGIESMAKSKDMVKRGRARRGTEVLERLEEAAVNTGGLEFVDFGDRDREQFRILEWLRRENATLLSSDTKLLDMAEREGNRVIRLEEVGPAAKQVVLPGEKLTLKLIRKGRNPGQGIGFLSDGTMVVVEEGDTLIGKEVKAIAHTTFRASGGTMVFSRVARNERQADSGENA